MNFTSLENENKELKKKLKALENKNIKLKETIEKEIEFKKLFFENISPCAINELIFDENNIPVDFYAIDANTAFLKEFNITREDYIGRKTSGFLPEAELKKWLNMFAPVAINGGSQQYDNYSHGSDKLYEGVVFSTKKNQFVIVFSDVTERENVNAKLKEAKINIEKSEEKFHRLFNENTDACLINKLIYENGELAEIIPIEANNAVETHFGKAPDLIINRKASEIASKEDFALWKGIIKKMLKENKRIPFKHYSENIGRFIEGVMYPLYDKHFAIICRNITKKIKEEESRRIERYYLLKAQEIGKVGTWHLNLKTNELNWTDELFTIFEVPPTKNISQKFFYKNVHPDDVDIVKKNLKASIYEGIPYNVEHRIIVNGKIKWLKEKADIEYNSKGEPMLAIGVTQDITNKKLIEEELILEKKRAEESEKRFRTLFEHMEQGFAMHELICDQEKKPIDYTFILMNDSFEKIIGKDKATIIGKTANSLQIFNNEEMITMYGRVAKTGKTIHIEEYVHENERIYDIVVYSPQKNFFVTVFNDITKNKIYERKLIKAKEQAETNEKKQIDQNSLIELNNRRLESLLKISQLSSFTSIKELLTITLHEAIELTGSKVGHIYTYNEETKTLRLSTLSEKALHKSKINTLPIVMHIDNAGCRGEAIRKKKPIIRNDYNAYGVCKNEATIGNEKIERFLSIPIMFDKKIIAVAAVANKKTNYDKTDTQQLTLLMDYAWKIAERIKLINDLNYAKEKAEESSRLKSEFLNNMSHEVRTPMNGMLGFAEMLIQPNLSDEKKNNYVRIIKNSSQQLLKIIESILEISIIETKQHELKETSFCLNDFTMELFSVFNMIATDKNISFYISNALPDDTVIKTDKIMLKKILNNLLDNALKFTVKGQIEFGYIAEKNTIKFFVKDTGIGISPKNAEIIFECFSQEEKGMLRKHGGLGLGLSIAKGIAKLMNGKITFTSQKGIGSSFYFTLPLKKENILHMDLTDDRRTDLKNKDTIKVLIAEDEIINYLYLETVFKKQTLVHYELIHAKNGKEAVDFCEKDGTIDIILMDIKMPIMNGLDATKNIRLIRPNIPIIAQTAYSTQREKNQAMDAGFNDFISKPINKGALIELLKKYITIE